MAGNVHDDGAVKARDPPLWDFCFVDFYIPFLVDTGDSKFREGLNQLEYCAGKHPEKPSSAQSNFTSDSYC
jgi:hypothetical protein